MNVSCNSVRSIDDDYVFFVYLNLTETELKIGGDSVVEHQISIFWKNKIWMLSQCTVYGIIPVICLNKLGNLVYLTSISIKSASYKNYKSELRFSHSRQR